MCYRTPQGRATAHKEEGNQHFRGKRYREAVEEYTAGVRELAGGEPDLLTLLYTNRAAAHYHLGEWVSVVVVAETSGVCGCVGNLRSCLNDVTQAVKLKPDHMKALHRG